MATALADIKTPRHLEAFAWWLDQNQEGRKCKSIAAHFEINQRTAEEWRSAFVRKLKATLDHHIDLKLKAYVKEYEAVQLDALATAQDLAATYRKRARELKHEAESGGKVNPTELGKIASGIKAVYSVAEQASGADVAKGKAKQTGGPGSGEGGVAGLPDYGAFFDVEGIETEGETVLNTDSTIEKRSSDNSSEENKGL